MRLYLSRGVSPLRGGILKDLKFPRAVNNAVELSSNSSSGDVPPVSLGIDLGTTNSVAAVVTAEYGPSLVPCSDSGDSWTLPSVVTFKKNGDVVVGEQAKCQAAIFPDNTFYSVKRLIGKDFKDVKKVWLLLPVLIGSIRCLLQAKHGSQHKNAGDWSAGIPGGGR